LGARRVKAVADVSLCSLVPSSFEIHTPFTLNFAYFCTSDAAPSSPLVFASASSLFLIAFSIIYLAVYSTLAYPRFPLHPCSASSLVLALLYLLCPAVVPRTRGHAHLQRVHPRNRHVERRVRPRRDAEREAVVPWARLYVQLHSMIALLSATDLSTSCHQTTTNCRSSLMFWAHRAWTTSMRSRVAGVVSVPTAVLAEC